MEQVGSGEDEELTDRKYDLVVIGGGPNGETLACYLQRAGAKVLLLERRHEMGGGLLTEDFAGFRFNLHATYMMMGELMPPFDDLFLLQYGVSFIRPEVQLSLFYEKNRALVFYLDPKKSAESIRKIAPGDDAKFLKLYGDFKEACEKCLIPALYLPPMPHEEHAAMLSGTETGRKVLELSELSPLEILEKYEIKDDRVKAAILYLGCKWGVEPDTRGIGHMFLIYAYRMLNAALVRGGSHRLNSGIIRSAYEAGIETRELTEARRIIIEDGEARGVITEAGEKIESRAVVSTLDPPKTFLGLVGEAELDPATAAAMKKWKWDEWSLFCLHIGTKRLPRYLAQDKEPHCGDAFSCVFGYDSVDQVVRHWKDCMNNKLPGPEATFTPTSIFDPSQAPTGYHNIRVETEAPFEVKGKDWESLKDDYGEKILQAWTEFITNHNEIGIVRKYSYPPSYIENKLPNMVRGSIKQGAYVPTQMGYLRPSASASGYATPIRGLYVAGAGVHPGGMITLGSGYAAARRIAEDLGFKVWWKTPKFIEEGRRLRLVG